MGRGGPDRPVTCPAPDEPQVRPLVALAGSLPCLAQGKEHGVDVTLKGGGWWGHAKIIQGLATLSRLEMA